MSETELQQVRRFVISVAEAIEKAHQRIKSLESENARLRRDLMDPPADIQELVIKKLNLVSAEALTQYRVALERCHVALVNWHALLRNLKTDYDNNSLAVLDQIQATKSKSLKALELSTPLIEKGRK